MHPGKQLFFGVILAASLVGCASVSAPRTSRPGPAAGEALFFALSTLDIDYRFGGSARESGFDCSGLVQYVFRSAYGIELPRLAVEQSRVGQGIERQRLEPGDLVFYNTLNQPYSHVGIYIGEDRFVHAPRAGAPVRVDSMRSDYWTRRFNGARRILTGRLVSG